MSVWLGNRAPHEGTRQLLVWMAVRRRWQLYHGELFAAYFVSIPLQGLNNLVQILHVRWVPPTVRCRPGTLGAPAVGKL